MKERSTAVDMVQGPLVKNIIRFAMPVMLSALLEMLFNAADTIIVGKFSGQHALAAVGATGSIIFLITSLFNGLSSGTNVVIARYLGASENDKVQKAVHTAIFTALVGGIFVLAVGFLSTNAFLRGMSTPDDIIDSSALYMHIYWFGAPFILLYDFGAAILRSRGDTKRPFYFLTIAGILNVLLNLLFVIGFRLSVAGVAIATVLSQMMACFLMLRTLLTEEPLIRLYPKKIALHKEILLEIIKIGVPAGIQGLVFSFSNIVIQSEINKLGSIVVAGNSAASNIENFVYIGMIGFSQAAITFTSQNLGAKKITRIKNTMLDTLLLNCVSTFLIALIITSFSGTFLSFYTNDMGVIEAGSILKHSQMVN